MPSFLFSATNRDGLAVNGRVESENLSQARYKLEIQGFSKITFYESELSNDVRRIFGKRGERAKNVWINNQVAGHYDNRVIRLLTNLVSSAALPLGAVLIIALLIRSTFSFLVLGFLILLIFYLTVPKIIFNNLYDAHLWCRNSAVRIWASIARMFNKVTINKIPDFEIDIYLSCADARKGRLKQAFDRLEKYRDDKLISNRLYNLATIRIHRSAQNYDEVLKIYESYFSEGNDGVETMLDYATCLARRYNRTTEAKEMLSRAEDYEMPEIAKPFGTYCHGIIEIEEGNPSKGEFYLRLAMKMLGPYQKNSRLAGLISEIKAFLAVALGDLGNKSEAEKLFQEAKPYLLAHRETQLLERCRQAIS